MRDVLDELTGWWAAGRPVAMATVVATSGSAPRPVATAMLVGPDGSVVGSVSGGCVESAVHAAAADVIATGTPVSQRYGIGADDAFAIGLACGGTVEVYVERVDRAGFPQLATVAAAIRGGTPVAVVTCVGAPDRPGGDPRLGRRLVLRASGAESPVAAGPADAGLVATGLVATGLVATGSIDVGLDAVVLDAAGEWLADGRSGILPVAAGGLRLFVSSFRPRPRMILAGAVDIAVPLSRLGELLGYQVTVCDARPAFAVARRFPETVEVVVDWPHRYLAAQAATGRGVDAGTVVCVLTHDPKFDDPLLRTALALPLRYVGALGSRRTHRERLARLREAGAGESELARLRAPIGLDLGGVTPEEVAVSVAAEIVAVRRGGSGAPLGATAGRIHHTPPEPAPPRPAGKEPVLPTR